MKTYISGKISGLDYEEVKIKFANAAQLLSDIGMEPVSPLDNGLEYSASWEDHLLADIEKLLTCDAILMLHDWTDSRGARIEKTIAEEKGIMILFESNITDTKSNLQIIKDAIQDVTGMRFDQYIAPGKERSAFYARMILIHHCRFVQKMDLPDIARLVNRDHSTVSYSLKSYRREVDYNIAFRKMVRKVNNFVNQCVLV